jgi:CheY-like chemotaxis protein
MGSTAQDCIYRRTAAGDKALTSTDGKVPTDYLRILAAIEGATHSDVIRGLLRQFPDKFLGDWLSEIEELGYVVSAPADPARDLDFTALSRKASAEPKAATLADKTRIDQQTREARAALDDAGAYLSPDRLKNRPPLDKAPGEIRVLVVEDDPDQAALANLRVTMAGYGVRIARSCKELAHEIRARALPDLLLLDAMLPDGNGFDILRNIRRHAKLALLPVIMLTALTERKEVRRGLGLGADGYITKPYSKNILTDTIRSVLKHA